MSRPADPILEEARMIAKGATGKMATGAHLQAVLSELGRVLDATTRLQCLLEGVSCLKRDGALKDAGGQPCRCSNCRVYQEVWDG
jgi:hypothetical protein